jgi:hypothetical protein
MAPPFLLPTQLLRQRGSPFLLTTVSFRQLSVALMFKRLVTLIRFPLLVFVEQIPKHHYSPKSIRSSVRLRRRVQRSYLRS